VGAAVSVVDMVIIYFYHGDVRRSFLRGVISHGIILGTAYSMKRAIAFVVVIGIPLAGWLLHAKREARLAEDRSAQVKRDAVYKAILAQFQTDLQFGTPRSGVKKHLESKGALYITYGNGDIAEKIGQDPGDSLFCDGWNVYVDFHFSGDQGRLDPSEFDHLSSIAINKIGHCL
jgi:hypothetical protein